MHRLEQLHIQVSLDGERLRCRAPKGALTTELQAEIAAAKAEIVRVLRASAVHVEPRIPRVDRTASLPLSFAQERLWFLHQLEPDNPAYNITACRHGADVLAPSTLESSLRALAARHDSLRTTFFDMNGRPFQRINTDSGAALRVVDLRPVPPGERERRVSELAREQTREAFDLVAGPLWRAMLIITADDRHTFVLTVHHIVADGWSLGILLRDLGELYAAQATGRRPMLADPAVQYVDYAAWQRQRLTDTALEPDVAYWRAKLDGAPRLLDLPLDRPRPAVQGYGGAVHRFMLPPAVSAAVKKLGQREGASLFMVLLAIFKTLMFRYTGSQDILVGTPVTTRSTPELENLVGMLVNTVVLRTSVSGDLTPRALLQRIRETVLEAHDHLELPFEQLVQVLRLERSRSHSSLVQTSFVLQNTPHSEDFETLSVSPMFEVSLFMWDGPEGIGGALEYRTELFDHETIARMAGHYVTLAAALAVEVDQPIGSAQILTSEERRQLSDNWNGTASAYPREALVHDIVDAQILKSPDRIAVRCGDHTRTGADVRARAAGLRDRLRGLGVGRGDVVGVFIDRSVDVPSVLLGVMQTGAAYLPLDPLYPTDRLTYMLEDSGARALIADRTFADRLPPTAIPIAWLERDGLPADGSLASDGDERASADDLAYILYTSGSTGRPKGVEITHRSVVNFLESMRQSPGLTERDRLLAVTTLCFDIAGLEIFLPLVCGAELVIATRAAVSDPAQLQHVLRTQAITVMQATPATWRMLLDAGWSGRAGFKILCGGEAMSRSLADRLLAGGADVWNLYGPTETTIWSTLERVTPGTDAIIVGSPIANTTVYVLDAHRQAQPIGVVGDLFIGGDGLARGYRNRPDLTAAAFVPNPFAPGERLYRTGDLARWRPDGRIELLGRGDHQVKIRGYRVELDEVANAARQHPGVRDAAVAVFTDNAGENALACYVVAPASDQLRDDLRKQLARQLPEYMVPSSVSFLDALPLTSNGKLDRKALPAPGLVVATRDANPTLPQDRIETQLVSIWEQVLGVQGIGTDDNFFDLGGHSLLAMKLFSHLGLVFGRLPVSLLFEAPTVREMAKRLTDEGRELRWRSLVAIQPNGDRLPLFLIPDVTGDVLTCTRLGSMLEPDRPIYGLHSVGLDGREAPLTSITEIASRYLAEIRSVQPVGPYHLAGVCIGGAVAFEIASQFQRAGESIASLTLIDTWAPHSVRHLVPMPAVGSLPFLASRLWDESQRLWRMAWPERWRELRRKLQLLNRLVVERQAHDSLRSEINRERVQRANYLAASRYEPPTYRGNIVLVAAAGRGTLTAEDPRFLWMRLAQGHHQLYRVNATTVSQILKEPLVERLAELLTETLASAEAGSQQAVA